MLGLAAALLTWSAAAASKPMHVMSLNLCTDGLLLDLVPLERIASVTYLSRSRSDSYQWSAAAKVPVNHGLAEEVLAEAPDLVMAGTYTPPATRALLSKAGMTLLEVPQASSFDEIRRLTRSVGHALGEDAKADELIARMDATLSALAATKPREVIRVVGWNGGGSVPGKGTLFDSILTAAGGINIASSMSGVRSGSFGIEELLMARPDILAYGTESNGAPALRTDTDLHPLVLKLYARRRVSYPEVLYSCGVPESADGAVALRASLLAAMREQGPP